MAFGFVKQAAQQAGKKMYGYGQQVGKRTGQFVEDNPITSGAVATAGVIGAAEITQPPGYEPLLPSDLDIRGKKVEEWLSKPWGDTKEEFSTIINLMEAQHQQFIDEKPWYVPKSTWNRKYLDHFQSFVHHVRNKPGAPSPDSEVWNILNQAIKESNERRGYKNR